MKLKTTQISSFLSHPISREVQAILVYGPDHGQVSESLDVIVTATVLDRRDPFQIREFSAASLQRDPFYLTNEAAVVTSVDRRQVIYIRSADDAITDAISCFLSTTGGQDALIIVTAGDLGKASKLRLLFEETPSVIAIPCYLDDYKMLNALIYNILHSFGLEIDPQALMYLREQLGRDRLQSRCELEKLALYVQATNRTLANLSDVQACIGDNSSLTLERFTFITADRDVVSTDRMYTRLLSEGVSPIEILRAVTRHFQKLQFVAGSKNRKEAINLLRPPLFFKLREQFSKQLHIWSKDELSRVLDLLTQTEIKCKSHIPAPLLCGHVLLCLTNIGGKHVLP